MPDTTHTRISPMNGDWRPRFKDHPNPQMKHDNNQSMNGTMPSLLAQLEMDYNQVQQVDAMLHEHLGNWLEHMEQWMHKQQEMFKQIQSQCSYLGLQDPEVLSPSDVEPLLQNSGYDSPGPAKPKQNIPPRLPAAVRMTPGAGDHELEALAAFSPERIKGDQAEVPTPGEWDPAYTGSGRSAPSKAVQNDSFNVNAALLEEANDFDEPPLSEAVAVGLQSPEPSRGHKGHTRFSVEVDGPLDLEVLDINIGDQSMTGRQLADSRPSASATVTDCSASYATASYMEQSRGVWEVLSDPGQAICKTDQARSVNVSHLPQEYRMWVQIVDVILLTAKKRKFYELREEWIQPDTWVNKVMRNHPGLDLRVLVTERHQGRSSQVSMNSGGAGTHSSPMSRMTTRVRQSQHHARRVSAFHFQKQPSGLHFGRQRTSLGTSSSELSGTKQKSATERMVLDPQSPPRLFWMSIGMLLMLYDLMVLPLNQAFVLPSSAFLSGMQWFSQCFWTLDIGVTFMTGVYLNSELVTDLRTIAKVYATSWLPFDVAVVAPLWIVQFMEVEDSSQRKASNTGVLRFIRMVRFLRLARLAKFEHYLQEALAAINSSSLILCVGIFKLMVMMIILSHLNACCWYAVGAAGSGGWVDAYDGTSLFYKYLTSMHWAFTQFQGTSEILPGMGEGKLTGERAYAVVCVMFALIILSFFVSSLTNMMMQLQALRNERVGMARAVREYLSDNNVSKGLSMRVKKYIDWKQRMQRKMGGADKVLAMLPVALQIDLQEETRGPILSPHKFFASLRYRHSRTFRIIVHEALQPLSPTPGEMVFSKQDEANRMYFVVSGLSRYMPTKIVPDQQRRERFHEEVRRTMIAPTAKEKEGEENSLEGAIQDVKQGNYLCEPVLWTFWEHRGVFMGVSDSHYLVLGTKEFGEIVKANNPSHVSSILYARQFIAGLNKFGKTYNDIIDLSALAEDDNDF